MMRAGLCARRIEVVEIAAVRKPDDQLVRAFGPEVIAGKGQWRHRPLRPVHPQQAGFVLAQPLARRRKDHLPLGLAAGPVAMPDPALKPPDAGKICQPWHLRPFPCRAVTPGVKTGRA